MDRRRRVVTKEEALLWREVMRQTKPLHPTAEEPVGEDVPPPPEPLPATPVKKRRPAPRPAQPSVPVRRPEPAAPSLSPLVRDHTPGLDKASAERLRLGEMTIEARLDLHGLTQQMAHGALSRFIFQTADRGLRCVLVITGKGNRDGTGVLRAQVPRWLNEPTLRASILAFSYARPKDGGEGALYILLKRKR